MISNTDSILFVYSMTHIRVKAYFRWGQATVRTRYAQLDYFQIADDSAGTSFLRFPELLCAGIVVRFARLSVGGRDAFSKTPTASNSVICFRLKLHLESKRTRHSRADNHADKCSSLFATGSLAQWKWKK